MERNARTGLAALIAVVAFLVVGLHRLGGIGGLAIDWSQPADWVEASAPELATGAVLRQLGLIVGYWVLMSTALYTSARLLNVSIPASQFLVLPVARRLVDRAVATSLAVSLLGPPLSLAAGAEPAVVFETSGDGIPVPHVRVIDLPATDPPVSLVPPVVVPAPIEQPPRPVVRQDPAVAPATTHIVVKGDNLWSIASAHLEFTTASTVSRDRIGEYWRLVVEQNRTTLRSGDPNLIYPGEMIVLPPAGGRT